MLLLPVLVPLAARAPAAPDARRGTAHAAPDTPLVPIAPLRLDIRTPHPLELRVEIALAIPEHDALEQLGGRYARRAPSGYEFAC